MSAIDPQPRKDGFPTAAGARTLRVISLVIGAGSLAYLAQREGVGWFAFLLAVLITGAVWAEARSPHGMEGSVSSISTLAATAVLAAVGTAALSGIGPESLRWASAAAFTVAWVAHLVWLGGRKQSHRSD